MKEEASPAAGVSAAAAREVELDDVSFMLEDIGWNKALSDFTRIDKETFAELVPVVLGPLSKVWDGVDDAVRRMHQRQGEQGVSAGSPTADDVYSHIVQMKTQRRNLQRRRADFLKR